MSKTSPPTARWLVAERYALPTSQCGSGADSLWKARCRISRYGALLFQLAVQARTIHVEEHGEQSEHQHPRSTECTTIGRAALGAACQLVTGGGQLAANLTRLQRLVVGEELVALIQLLELLIRMREEAAPRPCCATSLQRGVFGEQPLGARELLFPQRLADRALLQIVAGSRRAIRCRVERIAREQSSRAGNSLRRSAGAGDPRDRSALAGSALRG